MYRITGKIRGIVPFLFNRLIVEDLEPPDDKPSSKGAVTRQSRIEKAKEKVYRDERGLYWPGWNFKVCLLEGAAISRVKVGNYSLRTVLKGVVFPDHKLYFGVDEPDFIHEHWGKIPPKKGAAIIVRRPALEEGWELSFDLNVMDDRRTPGEIRRALDEAGLLVGMGSWRPEYGRFLVVEWQVEEEEADAKG